MSTLLRRRYDVPLADGRVMRFGERTFVMGVLNVTPDSFSDGGRFDDAGAAVAAALEMVAAGVDIIDVGGESTRPGAAPVDAAVERARVIPVLRALAGRVHVPLSIDTYKSEVARAALDEGASIVNDVSGLRQDPQLASVAARQRAALVLMHSRGRSADMYREAGYESVVDEVTSELRESMRMAAERGVSRDAIILDPGLGFGKRASHSLDVLARLDAGPWLDLDRPILVGASRKSFLQAAVGTAPPADRDWASAAAVAASVLLGAHIVRVHRVREMMQVVRVADAIRDRRA